MEQTYLCKFDPNGRRTETLLTCEFTDEKKAEKIADGYIEISEEDWNYYVGNKGQGANGTGYIRGKDGKPTDAPAHVPTKEEQLSALDAQYDADKATLMNYYTQALFAGDEEEQAALKDEMSEIDAQYIGDRKAIEEGSEE
jgi:hypothetical protein